MACKINGEAFSMQILGRKLVIGTSSGIASIYNIAYDPQNPNKVIGFNEVSELKVSNSPISLNFEFLTSDDIFLSDYDDNLIRINKGTVSKTLFDDGPINEIQMLKVKDKIILLAMGSGGFHIINTKDMNTIIKYSAEDLGIDDTMTLKIFKIVGDRSKIKSDLSNLEIIFSTQNPTNGKDGKLYRLYKGKVMIMKDAKKNPIKAELFVVNNEWLVTSDNNRRIVSIWTRTGVLQLEIKINGGKNFVHPSLALASSILAVGVSPTEIKIFDLKTLEEIKSVLVKRGFGSILLDISTLTMFYADVEGEEKEKGKYLTSYKNGCIKFIEFE